MKAINWNVTKEENRLIGQIAKRCCALFPDLDLDPISLAMYIVATHNHIVRLRLKDLLGASDANLMHDIAGITRHFDRESLVLRNGFWPRFAEKNT